MANWKSCTSIGHKHYNGGWEDGYCTKLYGGYAGNSGSGNKYCTVMRFKVPVAGKYKIKVRIPYVRSDGNSSMAKAGTFYLKLQSTDFTDIDKRPSSTSNTTTKDWTANDVEVHSVVVYITSTFKKDTFYYLVINSSKMIEVGHSNTPDSHKWLFQYDADYHTDVSKGTVTITDNYNNTFKVTATAGASGDNNTASLGDIDWGYTTSYGTKIANNTSPTLTTSGKGNTRTVYARAYTVGTKGDKIAASNSANIRQYFRPSAPGKPVLKYNKSRLTIKESWKYQWAEATSTNTTTSPVLGYRLILYKNGESVCIKNASGQELSTLSKKGTWYWDSNYKENGVPTVNIHPSLYGFKPGDTIKLAIKAFTRYGKGGANNKGAVLLNNDSSSGWTGSDLLTIQNSGVMRIRVGNTWKEGQVHVRVGNSWVEAESVKIKTANGWKESE